MNAREMLKALRNRQVPIEKEKKRRKSLENFRLSHFRSLHEPSLSPEERKTLRALLDEEYSYASVFHASKTFGKDIHKAKEYIDAPLKEGDALEVSGRTDSSAEHFISFIIDEPKKQNLMEFIQKIEKVFNEACGANQTEGGPKSRVHHKKAAGFLHPF